MQTLLKNNMNHILTTEVFHKDIINLKKSVDILNKDNFIIVSWMIWVWKLNFIKFLLESIWTYNGFFYLNPDFDSNNSILSSSDLEKYFNLHIKQYWNPKIIILENIINIRWVKSFINKIHKDKKYKLILIWNSIKINSIKEVTIAPKLLSLNTMELITYWRLHNILSIKDNLLKRRFLNLIRNEIILKDIISSFSVKQVNLLNQVITFISLLNTWVSLREVHKSLENRNIDISLITAIDYINYLLSSKMINRCYTYNLKIDKEITSKAKYYFTDNGIRNSFWTFNLDKDILIENFLFTQLLAKWYEVYNWKNWVFEFTFYWVNDNNNIYIHISRQNDKNELKKEVNKLLKIPWNWERFLVVNDKQISDMKIKKFIYDKVKIIKFEELIFDI